MLGNEPLSKWSLVTNSQSKLWGGMLMKCQSCHFISSNYRLACRPFNDHLQRCLQCIRGSTKSLSLSLSLSLAFTLSKNTHTHTCLHYRELAQTLTGTQKSTHWYASTHIFLYSLPKPLTSCLSAMCKTRTHWAGFSWPANQRLNRAFVITIALYLSITLHTFKTIPSHPCLYLCNHFRSNAQKFFIINQEWGSIKKGGVGSGMDEGRDKLVGFSSPVPNCCFRMRMQKGGITLII